MRNRARAGKPAPRHDGTKRPKVMQQAIERAAERDARTMRARQSGRWVSLACLVLLASTSCDPELKDARVRTPPALQR